MQFMYVASFGKEGGTMATAIENQRPNFGLLHSCKIVLNFHGLLQCIMGLVWGLIKAEND